MYIVHDLDAWQKIPLKNFTLKNCLFGATNIAKSSDKESFVYSAYGIAFDGKRKWNFDNDYARNAIICGVDNSSSSHSDNLKNNFLVLGEKVTFGINGSFGAPEKGLILILEKQTQTFAWVYNILLITVICLLMENI